MNNYNVIYFRISITVNSTLLNTGVIQYYNYRKMLLILNIMIIFKYHECKK